MSIPGFNDASLSEHINKFLTPSKEISDRSRLIGRERQLKNIERELYSPGRHIFIFGERGVGKTSLAQTSANSITSEVGKKIYLPCGSETTFSEIITTILEDIQSPSQAAFRKRSFSGSLPTGFGTLGASIGEAPNENIQTISSITGAVRLLGQAARNINGPLVVVIDEIDRMATSERTKFAELIKNASTEAENIHFILCGIGANVEELIGEHLSSARMIEPVEVPRLTPGQIIEIITNATEDIDFEVHREFLIRISVVSDGFPHFAHLIGSCLLWSVHDDPNEVKNCHSQHFKEALKSAIQKTESSLQLAYQKATEKTRRKDDYEEALWALADKVETRRQVASVYNESYIRINRIRGVAPTLSREEFNRRLHPLTKESHANVLVSHGSGYFSFRENIMRGYVRLRAEQQGVRLVDDPSPSTAAH